jgi:radical SAM superfamily enzyme YgiQ (UPF0313 family)
MKEGSNTAAKLHVLLVQLPVPNNPATNVPLAAGYLKAYAGAQGLLEQVAIEILPRALADHGGDALLVEEITARRPDVLGFSLYTWNSERSLDIAARAKARLPGLRVVVGGPEVQRDNDWVLRHPAVDIAVIGEGEQTFAELLRRWIDRGREMRGWDRLPPIPDPQSPIAGVAYRAADEIVLTSERAPLADLAVLPSPYLLGYLEPGGILMVEISRWCPYSCGFCLYGRNMGSKLGSRYFPLDRILDEIRWGRERGATQVHFVEANLNLVPLFWPLMRALEHLNADRALALYAELRGEHLTEPAVAALARAGLRVAEVGLQTSNPIALKVAHRKTDLQKWAAGTRRLASQGVEIYLDVILGLPADDAEGVAATLDFIRREDLGPYDVFTLQVLPGTETRRQVAEYGLVYQDRPPYYILATDRLNYADLRQLRRELKEGANVPPDVVEGMPEPRRSALIRRSHSLADDSLRMIDQLWFLTPDPAPADELVVRRLAAQVDVVLSVEQLAVYTPFLAAAIGRNPSTIFDVYISCEQAPEPARALRQWRETLPYQTGYLDRVAVYQAGEPARGYTRVSPRCFLLLPWILPIEPADFRGIAEVIWRFALADNDPVPVNAWHGAGGAGIWLHFMPDCTPSYRSQVMAIVDRWEQETGRRIWLAGGDK